MAKFGISAKLLLFSAIIFAGYAFLAWLASHKIHQTITSERIEMVHHVDEVAVSMVKTAYARFKSGELTEEAAKKLVKDQLRTVKYGASGEYYYIHDYEGLCILHGGKPEREGNNYYNFVDPNGRQIIKEQIEAGRNGTGAVFALSPVARGNSSEPVTKLSYATAFEPWHWVISTSMFVDDIDARYAEIAWQFFLVAGIVGLFMAVCAYWLSRQITRPLNRLVQFTEQPLSAAPSSEFERDLRLKDEIGTLARALQGFKERSVEAERLRSQVDVQKGEAEIARRKALADMVATVETETDTAVTGIDNRMTAMTEAASVMSRSAELVGASAQTVATASAQSLANAQTVASATEELSSSISGNQHPGLQCDQSHGRRGQPQRDRPHHDRNPGRSRHARRTSNDADFRDCFANQSPRPQRDHRGCACRRSRQGLCRGCERSEIAGDPDRAVDGGDQPPDQRNPEHHPGNRARHGRGQQHRAHDRRNCGLDRRGRRTAACGDQRDFAQCDRDGQWRPRGLEPDYRSLGRSDTPERRGRAGSQLRRRRQRSGVFVAEGHRDRRSQLCRGLIDIRGNHARITAAGHARPAGMIAAPQRDRTSCSRA